MRTRLVKGNPPIGSGSASAPARRRAHGVSAHPVMITIFAAVALLCVMTACTAVPGMTPQRSPTVPKSGSEVDPCPSIPALHGCAPYPGPAGIPVCCCSWSHDDETQEHARTRAWADGADRSMRWQSSRPALADDVRRWGCFPSLFIPGAQKAGTTALAALLSFVPGVTPPAVKEPHELDLKRWSSTASSVAMRFPPERSLRPLRYLTILGGEPQDENRGLFTFDSTPAYMLSAATIRRMAAAAPTARIIVLVRGAGSLPSCKCTPCFDPTCSCGTLSTGPGQSSR